MDVTFVDSYVSKRKYGNKDIIKLKPPFNYTDIMGE
jgi:hypothetical protein